MMGMDTLAGQIHATAPQPNPILHTAPTRRALYTPSWPRSPRVKISCIRYTEPSRNSQQPAYLPTVHLACMHACRKKTYQCKQGSEWPGRPLAYLYSVMKKEAVRYDGWVYKQAGQRGRQHYTTRRRGVGCWGFLSSTSSVICSSLLLSFRGWLKSVPKYLAQQGFCVHTGTYSTWRNMSLGCSAMVCSASSVPVQCFTHASRTSKGGVG